MCFFGTTQSNEVLEISLNKGEYFPNSQNAIIQLELFNNFDYVPVNF
ncbi:MULTISPECIES: hypothetical protein [unclassified Clostridium]